MATQKKSTKSTPSRTASSKSASSRSASARGGKRKAPPKKQPIRREVGGMVCLLLALFVGIGYFQHEALLIQWLYLLWRGLTGWGWYAALPALLLASWILLLHRGRPVTPHVVCALLLPVMLGAIVHIATMDVAPDSAGLLKALWTSGVALESGGTLSGALAVGFHAVLGKIGTLVVFVVGFVACLMAALRLTPAAIIDAVKRHEFVPYDEPEEQEPPASGRSYPPVPPNSPRRSPASTFPWTIRCPSRSRRRTLSRRPGPAFSARRRTMSARRTSCSPTRRSRNRRQSPRRSPTS